MKSQKVFAVFATLVILLNMVVISPVSAASTGASRQIPSAGTSSPQTGDFTPSGSSDQTQAEFPGQMDADGGPGPYPGTIVNRSFSTNTSNGVSVNSGKKAKSNPTVQHGLRRPELVPAALCARR